MLLRLLRLHIPNRSSVFAKIGFYELFYGGMNGRLQRDSSYSVIKVNMTFKGKIFIPSVA